MTQDTAILWWWLGILNSRRYNALKLVYGDLETALRQMSLDMLRELGLRPETAEKALARKESFDAGAYRATMETYGVHLLSIEDDDYPARLLQIEDAPPFLSYRGNLGLLNVPSLAMVGTRNMSAYGKQIVEKFVPGFVRAHLVITSGLALGIDAEVATQTLKAGGKTIAVLGNGLATIYPKTNARIASDILEHDGLILSEFPLDMQPDIYTFPARNRIIAGLCDGTMVCEAPLDSGSIITAELALEYNREVFAVPGNIYDTNREGCHDLIRKGEAHLVTVPDDVLRVLGILVPDRTIPPAYIPQSHREKEVLAVLTGLPQRTDDLMTKTGLEAADVAIALTFLQLAGVAKVMDGGLWVRA